MSLYCWDWHRESQTERQFNFIAELRDKDSGHTYNDIRDSRTEKQRWWEHS